MMAAHRVFLAGVLLAGLAWFGLAWHPYPITPIPGGLGGVPNATAQPTPQP